MSSISFTAITDGSSIDASDVNGPLNTIYDDYNGSIDSNNLADNAVTTAKITDANVTTAKIADANVTMPKISNPYKSRAHLASNQTINDNSATKITLDTETGLSYDPNSNFASNKYTAPVAGYYLINAQIWAQDDTAKLVSANGYIYKNNAAAITVSSNPSTDSTMSKVIFNFSDVLYLAKNDYVELYIYGDTSDSGTFIVAGGAGLTYLSIHLLSI